MTRFLGIVALLAASAATAAPTTADRPVPVAEMIKAASIVCPVNAPVGDMVAAGKAMRFSQRDNDLMRALCYMYHLGREDAYSHALRILDGPNNQ